MKHREREAFWADPTGCLRREIEGFVATSPWNRFRMLDGSPIFEAPLVGFASGDDPLFLQYKEVIGDFHLTPAEALEKHTGAPPSQGGVSVIAWVLPIARRTRDSNRRETTGPSRLWAYTRWYGERLNERLREHVVAYLSRLGIPAVAPMATPFFQRLELANGPASNWSERHVLYAAGLGTFSLSDGFITPRGMAVRCGSVVAGMAVEPTPRPYTSHLENCLFFQGLACDKCIRRCPAGAITKAGHDKIRCREYTRTVLEPLKGEYGVGITGCGLCQTAVPCEATIPVARRELALHRREGPARAAG